MPGGGGGRRDVQAADLSTLLARIDALERRNGQGLTSARGEHGGGASGGGGPRDHSAADSGGRRGPRGGARSGRVDGPANAGSRAKGRPGDWRCASCQAYPCFARTRTCFQCGAQRTDLSSSSGGGVAGARGGGGGSLSRTFGRDGYLGPIGAGGARPLLGGRGSAIPGGSRTAAASTPAGPPSFRVPGASLAARAEADAARSDLARQRGGGGGAVIDDAGFQQVRGGPPPAAAGGSAAVAKPFASRNKWADIAEDDDDEDDPMQRDDGSTGGGDMPGTGGGDGEDAGDQTGDGDGDDDAGGQGEGAATADGDEQGLRQAWVDHCRAYRVLERDPAMPAELVDNARALRDEAERRWRAARAPRPLSKRVRWAESDLRMAEEKEGAHRRELEAHLEATAKRTQELEARIAVDAARTARKRAALHSILAECAPEGMAGRGGMPTDIAATAVSGIESDIAPPLVAAIEKLSSPLEEGAAEGVRQELQLVAASLSSLEGLLRGSARPTVPLGSARHFDISGGDGDDGERMAGGGADSSTRGTANGPTGGASTVATTRWTKPAAGEPWRRASAAGATAPASTSSASAAEAARRLLCDHAAGAAAAAGQPPVANAAETNDLAEAARREQAAAQAQFHQAQLQQQQKWDAQRLQQEEVERQKRMARQDEERRNHLLALEKAAADRVAEETRQRERLVASMSPEDLAMAAEVHAQQLALGAQAFGSAAAANLAGLIHQEHVNGLAQSTAAAATATSQWDEREVQRVMEMSAEELAQEAGDHRGW